jgi:TetR/AcrR family transcriptional regulator, regulator of autoinduction and epiphytic fitness
MTDLAAAPRVDGRTARATRTRTAIVDAHLALISEGDLKPTGERIAERAGVSLRALWANFKDMEALFAASGERVFSRQAAEHRTISPDLPLARRVEEFCKQRVGMLEIIAPIARAAALKEPFSVALRRNRARLIGAVRDELETLFAAELDSAGTGRDQVVYGMTAASTWSAWSMLRDELELSVDEGYNVMVRTLTALLMAAIAAGVK